MSTLAQKALVGTLLGGAAGGGYHAMRGGDNEDLARRVGVGALGGLLTGAGAHAYAEHTPQGLEAWWSQNLDVSKPSFFSDNIGKDQASREAVVTAISDMTRNNKARIGRRILFDAIPNRLDSGGRVNPVTFVGIPGDNFLAKAEQWAQDIGHGGINWDDPQTQQAVRIYEESRKPWYLRDSAVSKLATDYGAHAALFRLGLI